MKAEITERPQTFDRVDRVKWAVGQEVLRGDDRLWILGGPLVVEIDGKAYEVPTGFTTDGASIPRIGQILTSWQPWEPPQRWAAIVHDYLYSTPRVAKAFADHAFAAVLRAEGANWYQTNVMYLAVRFVGGHAYKIDQDAGPMIYERDR